MLVQLQHTIISLRLGLALLYAAGTEEVFPELCLNYFCLFKMSKPSYNTSVCEVRNNDSIGQWPSLAGYHVMYRYLQPEQAPRI